jgi:hypothetical protein
VHLATRGNAAVDKVELEVGDPVGQAAAAAAGEDNLLARRVDGDVRSEVGLGATALILS